jgi:hypothetical protein
MKIYAKLAVVAAVAGMILFPSSGTDARTRDKKKDKSQDQVLRAAQGVFDLQQNRVSDISFYNTNYGIFGLNITANVGGGFWPRGSGNQYIFGGGVWFAALKLKEGETEPRKLAMISYNPNSGNSWLSPGRISEGDARRDDLSLKNRVYFSTDFTPDGVPAVKDDGPNWPIWDTEPNDTLKTNRYFGTYIDDIEQRNKTTFPKGPAYISQEDIFTTFKDTDLSRYELGKSTAIERGYPLRLQFEQTIYSWGFGDYKDFIFLKYVIINTSDDTLRECFMAPAMDMDIALGGPLASDGAENDHTRFYQEDTTLNLAVQWSDGNKGESGQGFGYIGFDFLESPAVDAQSFIRKDKRFYEGYEQRGLHTFRNWTIDIDPTTDEQRYQFMSTGLKDGDLGAGDKRFLMSTGPFNMLPGDTARVVVGLIMANAATDNGKKTTPTGTEEDISELVRKDKFAQFVYDNNFKAPKPPDVPRMTWEPINNGVIVHWDSTAELSFDNLEGGLDFLGYRLYRARNLNVDTFDVDYVYAQNRTPEGWKEIASWQLPYPFIKSDIRAENRTDSPFFDQIYLLSQSADSMTINVMRMGTGINPQFTYTQKTGTLTAYGINPLNEPWGAFYSGANFQNLRDTIFLGRIEIDRAISRSEVPVFNNLNDSAQRVSIIEKLYSLVQQNKADIIFPEFEDKPYVRNNIIVPFMKEFTNNRTFVDVGDDDDNGTITQTNNPASTEKLINGIDYYYRMLAYDEGDYRQPTPAKSTPSVTESNVIRTTPLAARAGQDVSISIIDSTADLFGGISNFKFLIKDQDRVQQLFAGHTLEVEFEPVTLGTFFGLRASERSNTGKFNGYYGVNIIFRDVTTGQLLAEYTTAFEPVQCGTIIGTFSENASVFIGDTAVCDTCLPKNFAEPTAVGKMGRAGTYTTDASCNAPNQYVYDALGFTFDYNFVQYGGVYRAFAGTVTKGDATPDMVKFSKVTQLAQFNPLTGQIETYNEGPAKFIVQFSQGGQENVAVKIGNTTNVVDFTLSYLNVKVFKSVSDTLTTGKILESYVEIPHQSLTNPDGILDVRDLSHNSYNLSAYGWVNGDWDTTTDGRRRNNVLERRKQSTQESTGTSVVPVGTQGRYYLTSVTPDGQNTIKFTHVFLADGATFGIDFANKQGPKASITYNMFPEQAIMPTNDIEAGDEVVFQTYGGAAGFPKTGAKIVAKVSDTTALTDYTNDILNQVQVVPNPYYVTHAGQNSQYDAKIYFTKLPAECTISIYTINGDLIRTINHNESSLPEANRTFRQGTDVWDLLSDNKQRSASQVLIAKIETPNGASSIVKFSIVTGGYRQVP